MFICLIRVTHIIFANTSLNLRVKNSHPLLSNHTHVNNSFKGQNKWINNHFEYDPVTVHT